MEKGEIFNTQILEFYGELSGFWLGLHPTWAYELPVDEDIEVLAPCHDKKDEVEVKIWIKEQWSDESGFLLVINYGGSKSTKSFEKSEKNSNVGACLFEFIFHHSRKAQ